LRRRGLGGGFSEVVEVILCTFLSAFFGYFRVIFITPVLALIAWSSSFGKGGLEGIFFV